MENKSKLRWDGWAAAFVMVCYIVYFCQQESTFDAGANALTSIKRAIQLIACAVWIAGISREKQPTLYLFSLWTTFVLLVLLVVGLNGPTLWGLFTKIWGAIITPY